MFCSKCGNQLNTEDKFCKNCGAETQSVTQSQVVNQPNNEINQPNPIHQEFGNPNQNMNNQTIQSQPNNTQQYQTPRNLNNNTNGFDIKKYLPFIIGGVVLLIVIISIINSVGGNNNNNNSNNNNNNSNNGNNSNSQIKGQYSREVFSGKSFDYKTSYDNAVITFNSDSSFEFAYAGGSTYKGNYEIYNGLFIAIKADEISQDPSIQNAKALANDIKNISNNMMSTPESMLNTYLLWLQTNDNVLQPFVVQYESSTNSGIIVSIMGQTQGSITLR